MLDLSDSMLNGMLAVGVPMMALLAAALYMLKRSMTESPQGPGTRTTCRDPWGAGTCCLCRGCLSLCVHSFELCLAMSFVIRLDYVLSCQQSLSFF